MKKYYIVFPHVLETNLCSIDGFVKKFGDDFDIIKKQTKYNLRFHLYEKKMQVSKFGEFEDNIEFWSNFTIYDDKYNLYLYDENYILIETIPLYNKIEKRGGFNYLRIPHDESENKLINLVIDICDGKYNIVEDTEPIVKKSSFYKKTEV